MQEPSLLHDTVPLPALPAVKVSVEGLSSVSLPVNVMSSGVPSEVVTDRFATVGALLVTVIVTVAGAAESEVPSFAL